MSAMIFHVHTNSVKNNNGTQSSLLEKSNDRINLIVVLNFQGVPVRQLPIIDRFLRQLWSTFLFHFSILQNTEKLMEIFDYGTTRLKVFNKFFVILT